MVISAIKSKYQAPDLLTYSKGIAKHKLQRFLLSITGSVPFKYFALYDDICERNKLQISNGYSSSEICPV